jgi:hypothetical protein
MEKVAGEKGLVEALPFLHFDEKDSNKSDIRQANEKCSSYSDQKWPMSSILFARNDYYVIPPLPPPGLVYNNVEHDPDGFRRRE